MSIAIDWPLEHIMPNWKNSSGPWARAALSGFACAKLDIRSSIDPPKGE
jgi:hypothetical protein